MGRNRTPKDPMRHAARLRWANMIHRCTNPRHPNFKYYGARGITVCDRWMNFDEFWRDVGNAPAGMSMDRIDNARGYEPGNIRWATKTEQMRNRRTVRMVGVAGQMISVCDLADASGLNSKTVRDRLDRGWPTERALTEPVKNVGARTHNLTVQS